MNKLLINASVYLCLAHLCCGLDTPNIKVDQSAPKPENVSTKKPEDVSTKKPKDDGTKKPDKAEEIGIINLDDYQKIKDLTPGKTNRVELWKQKNSDQQIVVKTPFIKNDDLVAHNIKTINAFFGKSTSWPVSGQDSFAMKFFQGVPLSSQEEKDYIDNKDSPIRTIEKNGKKFTMLDPNVENFLKLPSGEIIPIDFDYMLDHDDKQILKYQKEYLTQRMLGAQRFGASEESALINVIMSYPGAKKYLFDGWGIDAAMSAGLSIDGLKKKLSVT